MLAYISFNSSTNECNWKVHSLVKEMKLIAKMHGEYNIKKS
jgi:hypothetical protein